MLKLPPDILLAKSIKKLKYLKINRMPKFIKKHKKTASFILVLESRLFSIKIPVM